ncbi:glycosyltransferase family 4 protein [uncultured Salinisphaera sp.]|uniref:glycosyltransferase family 4 protein n=1 Tax=uncultured Salinisphaera sp. TaxID=359372 RepID=UPI0032B10210|tara:strand:+ start:1730 stop:2842 length:1113 start_codon:yes stop_codon:yes gene_type:complete
MVHARPIRVLHICNVYFPHGSVESIIDAIVAKSDYGFLHYVATLERPSVHVLPWSEAVQKYGHSIRKICIESRYNAFKVLSRLRRLCREHEVDVLHCHMGWSLVIGRAASLMLGMPLVITFHSECLRYNAAVRWSLKLLPRRNCTYIGVSNAVADQWARWLKYPVWLIGNPLKLSVCSDSQLQQRSANHVRLVVVARLTPVKRIDLAIRLVKALVDRGACPQLTIVGAGSELVRLKKLANSLGITRHLEFVGFQSDVTQWLDDADYFVLSSDYEGFCMAAIEAMARGALVVTHQLPALADYAEDNATAIVTRCRDVESWAERILELQETPERLLTMKHSARQVVAEKFRVESVVKRYEAVYRNSAHRAAT